MASAFSIISNASLSLYHKQYPFVNVPTFTPSFSISKPFKPSAIRIKAATTPNPTKSSDNTIIQNFKLTARAVVFAAAAAAVISKFHQYSAIAEPTAPIAASTEPESQPETRLPEFLELNPEAVAAMKTLLEKKLEAGEDEECLKILKKLVLAQPKNLEWKFLMARLLNEMGDIESAREGFEEILSKNPLSFEALFENALLMDKNGEGEAVIKRLEKALEIAEEENKMKEARDVRLIMAQVQFLQKNIDEALRSYDELSMEDPKDFRPYFCKGLIYSLMDKNSEAKEQFAKYRELSPKKFEVEGYLRTPLSRMKLFGTDEQN